MCTELHSAEQFRSDIQALGIRSGDTIMMHSSYKSLGGIEGGAKSIFGELLDVLGEDGTLILPAFSYATVNYNNPIFDITQTPVCVGYLPEYFRTQVQGVIRSMHATHSCSAKGRLAEALCAGHELDLTPVGEHSPLSKLPNYEGKIFIMGCNPGSNTIMHGVEEKANAPYLFDYDRPIPYILRNGDCTIEQTALRHYFYRETYLYKQCYQRVIPLLTGEECKYGKVLDADCYLLSARAVWDRGYEMLLKDPYYFVDRIAYKQ